MASAASAAPGGTGNVFRASSHEVANDPQHSISSSIRADDSLESESSSPVADQALERPAIDEARISTPEPSRPSILQGTEYIGLKYGPQTILLLDPNSSDPENAVTLVQHYQGSPQMGLQVMGKFHFQDSPPSQLNIGDSIAVARAQEFARLMRREREESEEGKDQQGDERAGASGDPMRELQDLLTKLNPMAKEFVPPNSYSEAGPSSPPALGKGTSQKKTKNGFSGGKKKSVARNSRAQREDSIRRTVYVSDIDQQVTEEQLAALFLTCGQVVDCRVCGDPNSVLRFAFVEFTDEDGARAALSLAGTVLGYYPVRVLPSKTAIVPVNPTFLPRSEDEREMCGRTIYCTNIDKKPSLFLFPSSRISISFCSSSAYLFRFLITLCFSLQTFCFPPPFSPHISSFLCVFGGSKQVTQADVKLFFESLCGEVSRLRLLGDYHHQTRIAFVEFLMAESAMAALNCSGAILGSLPIRVSPSKTPVRPRSPRQQQP